MLRSRLISTVASAAVGVAALALAQQPPVAATKSLKCGA
jgi:hypothetical protein